MTNPNSNPADTVCDVESGAETENRSGMEFGSSDVDADADADADTDADTDLDLDSQMHDKTDRENNENHNHNEQDIADDEEFQSHSYQQETTEAAMESSSAVHTSQNAAISNPNPTSSTANSTDKTSTTSDITRARREKRLAMNRRSARSRRKRKKVLLESLNAQVLDLTRRLAEYEEHLIPALRTKASNLQVALNQSNAVLFNLLAANQSANANATATATRTLPPTAGAVAALGTTAADTMTAHYRNQQQQQQDHQLYQNALWGAQLRALLQSQTQPAAAAAAVPTQSLQELLPLLTGLDVAAAVAKAANRSVNAKAPPPTEPSVSAIRPPSEPSPSSPTDALNAKQQQQQQLNAALLTVLGQQHHHHHHHQAAQAAQAAQAQAQQRITPSGLPMHTTPPAVVNLPAPPPPLRYDLSWQASLLSPTASAAATTASPQAALLSQHQQEQHQQPQLTVAIHQQLRYLQQVKQLQPYPQQQQQQQQQDASAKPPQHKPK